MKLEMSAKQRELLIRSLAGLGGIGGGREKAMEAPGVAPGARKPPREASVNPADLRRGRHELSYGGSGPPLKLLAEAKSDENKRRLRVGDLTRPGPVARRIYIIIDAYIIYTYEYVNM